MYMLVIIDSKSVQLAIASDNPHHVVLRDSHTISAIYAAFPICVILIEEQLTAWAFSRSRKGGGARDYL